MRFFFLLSNSLHASPSIAILLQFWIFGFTRSSLTSPSHPNLSLPILTVIGLQSVILSTVLSSFSLSICTISLILCAFTYLSTRISSYLISKSVSSLFPIERYKLWSAVFIDCLLLCFGSGSNTFLKNEILKFF